MIRLASSSNGLVGYQNYPCGSVCVVGIALDANETSIAFVEQITATAAVVRHARRLRDKYPFAHGLCLHRNLWNRFFLRVDERDEPDEDQGNEPHRERGSMTHYGTGVLVPQPSR